MNQIATATDGTKLAYRTYGDGPLAVLLVHGWMASSAVWSLMLEALGTEGLRLIVPDLRGTGASGKPDTGYTLEQYAKDLLAVADHAKATRFAVVGSSMGGQLTQLLAATVPERVVGALAMCPVPASGAPLPPELADLFRSSAQNREKQQKILEIVTKELPASARDAMLADAATIPAACIEGAYDAWTKGGFEAKLGGIKAPLLVLGTDDPALPRAFLVDAIVTKVAGAQLAYLPGPGHYPQNERPRETAAIVRAFLSALR